MPTCNICGGTEFTEFNKRDQALCKSCLSLERHRALRYVLEKCGYIKDDIFPHKRVLHLAPEKATWSYMSKIYPFYLATDMAPEKYSHLKCLKMRFPDDFSIFPSDYFDLILHNHVLEHFYGDYRLHILEFIRLLCPSGQMIFSIPFWGDKKVTIQGGENLQSDEERIKLFGQRDHVKRFGKDFLDFFALLKGNFEILRMPAEIANEANAADQIFVYTKCE